MAETSANGRKKMRQQVTFVLNSQTAGALAALKNTFGVKTNAAAVRKALALARVVSENASDNNTITIVGRDNKKKEVLLAE